MKRYTNHLYDLFEDMVVILISFTTFFFITLGPHFLTPIICLQFLTNYKKPLIVTHGSHMTILLTTFTPPYLQYIMGAGTELDSGTPILQIYCIKTHDLKKSVGRKNAAKDLPRNS
jgi:hypothetical protein